MSNSVSKSKSFQQHVRDYERSQGDASHPDGMAQALALIDGLREACSSGGFVEKGVATDKLEHWYTRAAAALTRFITSPAARVKKPGLVSMATRKQSVAYIFSASGFRGMAHLVDMIKEIQDDGRETIHAPQAAVLLVFIGLDDMPDVLMDIALAQPPEILFYLMLGWLNQRAVLTPQGEKNRGRLLTSGELIKSVEITDQDIPPLINTWMYSSYASEPRKHDIKKWFNSLMEKRLRSAGIAPAAVTHTVQQRPKMLIIHERFMHQHAMFRCYAPALRTLRPYFETVAISDAIMIDDLASEVFDSVIRLEDPRPSIKDLVALIEAQRPDVIYYPSLGMSYWTVMLAGLRLAPIQIMTHGHPATSCLETIDYVYVCEMHGDLSKVHSERVIMGPVDAMFEAHSDLPQELPPLLPPSRREVRIAVNSKVMKLSWRLLEICKRLQREATVPVTFSFFPGERFAYMDGLDAAIRAQLPSAKVIPYVGYEKFLSELCKCDLALAAFPFGNTNSTVDTSLLGLPTVAHFGPENPAQSDSIVLRNAGLPEWLVSDNDEDYFRTALRLVNDPSARIEAMAGLDRKELRRRLLKETAPEESPFGETFHAVYRNHGRLINASKRVFDYTELLDMSR